MSKFSFRYIVVLLLFILIPKSVDEQAVTYSSLNIDTSLLQDGDIIFRRGISLISNMVLFVSNATSENDSDSPYSHVGIISFYDGIPYVIHAVPDESENGIDYIRRDSLKLFLRTDRASAYAVIRYNDPEISYKASTFSKAFYNKKILFDNEFSLNDSTKFYCTELVLRAYKKAGVKLTADKFDTLAIPLGQNPYLLPETILHSPNTKEITKSTNKKRG